MEKVCILAAHIGGDPMENHRKRQNSHHLVRVEALGLCVREPYAPPIHGLDAVPHPPEQKQRKFLRSPIGLAVFAIDNNILL
jgi:hypothetical protein